MELTGALQMPNGKASKWPSEGALYELGAHLELSRYPYGRASKLPLEVALFALGAHLEFTK